MRITTKTTGIECAKTPLRSQTNFDRIQQGIAILFEPGQVVEIRALGTFGTTSGYFDNHRKLAAAIEELSDSGKYEGVYFTLNPCHAALLSRREKNALHHGVRETTTDSDIVRRRWLLIDIDPKRPKGVSSTWEEVNAAWAVAQRVMDWLESLGWPEPVIAMSGNGFHLLYPVNEPNDRETTQIFRECIAVISDKFSTDRVEVDRKVFNAARIIKAYGSLAAKGVSTKERPHRLSRIQFVPVSVEIVKRMQLERLSKMTAALSNAKNGQAPNAIRIGADEVEKFLQWGGLRFRSVGEYQGGTRWIFDECFFNPEHNRGEVCVIQYADGALKYSCLHESCQENNWKKFRAAVEEVKGEKFSFATGSETMEHRTRGAGESIITTPSWPDPPACEAYYGLAGDIVRAIEPHSESDPVALLAQILAMAGNVVGRGPHFTAEADRHGMNIFPLIVGVSAKGRKGSSLSQIKRVFSEVDANWLSVCMQSGLSSGEGLIWAVRDPIERREPIKKNGRVTGYLTVITDHGVEDKRLLVVETEFASVLRILGREGNTLSATVRQAWDSGDLRILTKNSPARATGAHISIIGQITRDELRRYLDSTEVGNGFANRFLYVCVRRSKILPFGGKLDESDVVTIGHHLQEAVDFARDVHQMRCGTKAEKLWIEIYAELSEGRPGLLGAVTSRADPQVMRLACIYALLDRSSFIRVEHLRAALAFWEYCAASARFTFGDALGNPVADELLSALRKNPKGLTRTEMRDLFARNRKSQEIDSALQSLAEYGQARSELSGSEKGRPSERWFALAVAQKKGETA